MRSLLIGATSEGAVALSVEPSAALACGFEPAGAGVKGVETEHAHVVASSRQTELQIVAIFTIFLRSPDVGWPGCIPRRGRILQLPNLIHKEFIIVSCNWASARINQCWVDRRVRAAPGRFATMPLKTINVERASASASGTPRGCRSQTIRPCGAPKPASEIGIMSAIKPAGMNSR